MKTITMLEFRKQAGRIVQQLERGERFLLTYRGRPVARLEPARDEAVPADDPFYDLLVIDDPNGSSLTNEQIDAVIYGV